MPRNADKSEKPHLPTRRIGNESSATRVLILDTTERLMIDEGYAAVTTRRVATEIGVKAPLVHYYFPTTDDLFLAVYRRAAEQVYQRLDEALASERPLHMLWSFVSDASRTTLAVEFMALANHRKVIGKELTIYTERTRRRQTEALESVLKNSTATVGECSSLALSVLLVGAARALVMENSVGISLGHDEARAVIEQWLDQAEPPTAKRPRRTRT